MHGISFRSVASVTTCRVPKIGMRNVCRILSVPPARPGIAVSQNNCIVSNLKPTPGSRTTTALIMNQVAKDSIKVSDVIVSVLQAIFAPISFQNPAFSGSQRSIQVPVGRCLLVVVIGDLLRLDVQTSAFYSGLP